jgi:hypothetical protein
MAVGIIRHPVKEAGQVQSAYYRARYLINRLQEMFAVPGIAADQIPIACFNQVEGRVGWC